MAKDFIQLMVFLADFCVLYANGMAKVPQNITVMVNETASFSCATASNPEEILWYHGNDLIYADGGFYKRFQQRFSVNLSKGESTLSIFPVFPKDAGKYACDAGFASDQSFAFLTVLCSEGTVNQTVGDVVTCSDIHVGRNCSFTWRKLASHTTVFTSPVSYQNSFKFEQPGTYICELVCIFDGIPCTCSRMLNVYEKQGAEKSFFLAVISIPVIVCLLLIMTVIFIICWRKKGYRTSNLTLPLPVDRDGLLRNNRIDPINNAEAMCRGHCSANATEDMETKADDLPDPSISLQSFQNAAFNISD